VLAQAVRRPERQVRLSRFIRQLTTDVVNLDRVDATSVGRLLAASGTSDIADAHVVICARRSGQPVVTCAISRGNLPAGISPTAAGLPARAAATLTTLRSAVASAALNLFESATTTSDPVPDQHQAHRRLAHPDDRHQRSGRIGP
jgi:cytosine/adenosine deaminase-related metal-dependent hydrolase